MTVGRGVRRYNTPEAWRELIAERRLRRDDVIGVERDDSPLVRMPAAQAPELAALFEAVDPPPWREHAAHARRETPLLSAARVDAPVIRRLARGEAVTLRGERADPDPPRQGLVPVVVGTESGFAPASAFAPGEPPTLEGPAGSAPRLVQRRLPVFAAPDLAGEPLRQLGQGDQVLEIGRTCAGPLEILLPSGEVAYADPSLLVAEPRPAPKTSPPATPPSPKPATPAAAKAPPPPLAAGASSAGAASAAAPLARPAPKPAAPPGKPTSQPASSPQTARPATASKRPGSGVLLVAVGVIGLVILALVFQGGQPKVLGPAHVVYATGQANIRDAPKGEGVQKGQLARGDPITGQYILGGDDGHTPWLKITEGAYLGDYVWNRNLSDLPRPALKALRRRRLVALAVTDLHAEPEATAAPAATPQLAAGQSVLADGITGSGWVEVTFVSGGVGYAPASAFGLR